MMVAKSGGHRYGVGRPSLQYERKSGKRKPRQTILIVCEGKETEPRYFGAIKRQLRLSSVGIKSGKGGNCCKTVQTAVGYKHEEEYDHCWCVFDTEASSNAEDLQAAIELANKHGIKLAISNPSFEYWLLLHFTCTDRSFRDAQEVIGELRRYIPEYQKNGDVYAQVQQHTQTAITNAQSVLDLHCASAGGEFANPSTHVHKLVEELYKLKEM